MCCKHVVNSKDPYRKTDVDETFLGIDVLESFMFTSLLRRYLHVSYRDIYRKKKSVYFISLCFLIEQI